MTFSERMQGIINKGIEASRDAVTKAKDQAQTWGEMGVLKIEIMQLRSQAEKTIARLGAHVYAEFAEMGQTSISSEAPAIKALIANVREIEAAIDDKEARYRRLGGKDSDLEPQM